VSGCESLKGIGKNAGLLGNPYQADYPEGEQIYARNIWDMQLYKGKIYLGAGNSSNTGPAQNSGRVAIYSLQPDTGIFHDEYIAAEEQIDRFLVYDEILYVPGHDATQTWDFGNIYFLDQASGQWVKRRTLPQALHVYDLLVQDGCIYAAGSVPEFGAVFTSTDDGTTWSVQQLGSARIHSLFSLEGTVYAAEVFRTDTRADNSLFVSASATPFQRLTGSTAHNVFPETRFDADRVKMIRPVSAGDQLYYIGAYVHNDHQNRPFGLYRMMSQNSAMTFERLELEAGFVPRDILVRQNTLLILADTVTTTGSLVKVYAMDIAANSGPYPILEFNHTGFARSFEEADGRFYFGMGCEIVDPEHWSQTELADHTGDIIVIKYHESGTRDRW